MRWRKVLQDAHEWVRYVEERWLIVPAARWMPVSVALNLAWLLASLELLLPSETSRESRAEIRSMGITGRSAASLAQQRLAVGYYDLVWLTRMRYGRERSARWEILESGREHVDDLFRQGPLVLATAHFSVAALTAIQSVLPRSFAYLASEDTTPPSGPRDRRAQLARVSRDLGRLGQLTPELPEEELFVKVPLPESMWSHPEARTASVRELLRRLRRGDVVLLRVDAYWGAEGGLARPFAGMKQRTFALGAARIARVAHSPVIPFAAYADGRKRVVRLEWFPPLMPRMRGTEDDDREVMNEVLTHLEGAVRHAPTAYLHPLGSERAWT